MKKDLTNSRIDRQNVLNNRYAIEEIQKAAGVRGILYEGQFRLTRGQVAEFFEVDERTISRYLENFEDEISKNGYEVLRGNNLNKLKLWLSKHDVKDIHVPNKASAFGLFNFRAFLNLAMLLVESEKARILRAVILDIVIDTINKRTGGGTKYINQRDEDFVVNLLKGEIYQKEFTNALRDYVDMGNAKHAIYTNKIYRSIFKENAEEYRQVLKLAAKENVRDTMYSEILDLVASYEVGFAEELKKTSNKMSRKLTPYEVDQLFRKFESHPLWKPLREKARNKMASRDLGFRDALHENLKEYISAIEPADFDRFLGEKSKSLEERLHEAREVFKRLKERE
ncbi:MAG: DNA-binding protein [Bacteroidales bacterium]|nr:DNA-binding protein [Bacteroidales bacterium]